jgi:chorismate mutase-like protein
MNKQLVAMHRAEIDALDAQLLCLLSRRAEIVSELGRLKRRCGLPLCDPVREARVLARLREFNPGPLDDRSVTRIFRRIIREARRLQGSSENGSGLKKNHRTTRSVRS